MSDRLLSSLQDGESLSLLVEGHFSEVEKQALRAISAAVYPPEVMKEWPGKGIEWCSAQWRVVVWGNQGQILSHVALVLREGLAGGKPALIAGIGGVMTHPEVRRRGLATLAIGRARQHFLEQGAEFELLVCDPALIRTYSRMGWKQHPGPLYVMQGGERVPFTFNLCMVRDACGQAPVEGEIDLQGAPW